MEILVDDFPEIYRAAVAKYVKSQGNQLSDADEELLHRALSDEGWKSYSGRIKAAVAKLKADSSLQS